MDGSLRALDIRNGCQEKNQTKSVGRDTKGAEEVGRGSTVTCLKANRHAGIAWLDCLALRHAPFAKFKFGFQPTLVLSSSSTTSTTRLTPYSASNSHLSLFSETFCIFTSHRSRSVSAIMFKGIIPSKRTASIDFQMVTPLGDSHGKENEPHPPFIQVSVPSSTSRATNKPKTEKSKTKKGSPSAVTLAEQLGEMDEAFDKLLVS